jgi:ATP-dependent protease ClpP protease subunit
MTMALILNTRAVELAKAVRPEKRLQLFNRGGTSELYLYDVIGPDFGGISAEDVVAQLRQAKGSALEVHICSEGGDVFEAKAVYNAIVQFKGPKTCLVDGLAASAASWVMCAGDRVMAAPNSTFMTHGVQTIVAGDSANLRQMADQMDVESKSIAGIYARKTGKPEAEMLDLLREERWFDCAKAQALGLIDGIYEIPKPVASTTANKLKNFSPIDVMRLRAQAIGGRLPVLDR